MHNSVGNLNSKGIPSYAEVQGPLQDIIDKRSFKETTNTYHTVTTTRHSGAQPRKDRHHDGGCTWCNKYGYFYKNHVFKTCRRAKPNFQGSKVKKRAHRPDTANQAAVKEEATALVAVMEHGLTSIATNAPSPWIFDTGASRHMTCLDDFSDFRTAHGTIQIAGGQTIPSTGLSPFL
ncbi:hypothetical protein K470DRAFT_140597 [Piedraia hortae CBS 480.64]|uniref:Uncharacterized protein n=1 Tax=Piedraia hortae CBS 480.64 TaxID=1314780 RepID=A0A6A7C849_9PEZI|nr:hypothetical protein K470DRAFT_140597 [Piedraia hortae CBS 480.64]